MNNDRGLRRKIDYHHALRKKHHDLGGINYDWSPWYNNLHQYSKNKIHCSCDMCNRRKSSINAGDNCIKHYSITDQKKIVSQFAQMKEFDAENFSD